MINNKTFEEGHKAFYDDVVREQNPYLDPDPEIPMKPLELEIFKQMSELWFCGWDIASKEHELFVKTQDIKVKLRYFEEQNKKLQADRDIYIKSTRGTINCYYETEKIVNSLIVYIKNTNRLFFSREKMITELKTLLEIEDSESILKQLKTLSKE